MATPPIKGYLGIDIGTQGVSVIFTSDETLEVLATGEASYGMIPHLPEGHYEQSTNAWEAALQVAMKQVKDQLLLSSVKEKIRNDDDNITKAPLVDASNFHENLFQVLAIGIAGQMHGEVLADENGLALGTVRLWCDARNALEANELTKAFQVKIPKRSTVARFLYTLRNDPNRAIATRHITTPAGWISYCLTGQWTLGIGDASGMFPVDHHIMDYNESLLQKFDHDFALIPVTHNNPNLSSSSTSSSSSSSMIPPLRSLLPTIRRAGHDAGYLNERGAQLLGLPKSTIGIIPVAPAEGDQPASLAGSLIARAGMVSCSFGTSVCANVVATKSFANGFVSPAVDHFSAVDGQPIHMVWLRNGTTFLNTIVEHYGMTVETVTTAAMKTTSDIKHYTDSNNSNSSGGGGVVNAFLHIMPQLIQAPPDCGGLLALPFMDDEPGLRVSQGGTALIMGLNSTNATAGNIAKAALLATMFNLRLGCDVVLGQQGGGGSDGRSTELVLTGGLTKTPACGQILADVFDTPTTLLESADEGCCWGAALLAKYRYLATQTTNHEPTISWVDFLQTIQPKGRREFVPNPSAVIAYQEMLHRYKKLIALQPLLQEATMG